MDVAPYDIAHSMRDELMRSSELPLHVVTVCKVTCVRSVGVDARAGAGTPCDRGCVPQVGRGSGHL